MEILNWLLPVIVSALVILVLWQAYKNLRGKNTIEQERADRIFKAKKQQEENGKGGVSKTFWVDKDKLD